MITRGTRRWLTSILAVLLLASASWAFAGGEKEAPQPAATKAEKVQLKYTFWGSPMEKQVVEDMIRAYEAKNPNTDVEGIHVPGDYATKLSAMAAAGDAPDVFYLIYDLIFPWADSGKLMNLYPWFEKDPEVNIEDRLEQVWYWYGPGKTVGSSTAAEIFLMFYNKDLFDEAGVPYPPAKAEEAWDWNTFVSVAKKLTVDRNGRHPDEAGFDPLRIRTYGVDMKWNDERVLLSLIWSNGGAFFNDKVTEPRLTEPATVEAVERIADLIYKHRVAPPPALRGTTSGAWPSWTALQTRQVAMTIDGQWALLDMANSKFNFGIGVLPKFKEPTTIFSAACTVIWAETKHPDQAWDFYKWTTKTSNNLAIFQSGLWMPLEKKYYSDPQLLAQWIDNPAHPREYKTAAVDYMKYAKQRPVYYAKNYMEIINKYIRPGLDPVWLGSEEPAEALGKIAQQIKPFLQGRYEH